MLHIRTTVSAYFLNSPSNAMIRKPKIECIVVRLVNYSFRYLMAFGSFTIVKFR